MKFEYILVSLAIASLNEAAPVKRGFFDELFGISTTTSTPVVAVQPATTPVVQTVASITPAVTTPVTQVAATTSSVGFWGRLFGGGRSSTTQPVTTAVAPATQVANTPAAAITTAQAVQATPAVAATQAATTTSSSSRGLFSSLWNSFFGGSSGLSSSSTTTSTAAAAAPVAQTTTQPQQSISTTALFSTPLVVTSEQVFVSVVTPVQSAAATANVGSLSSSDSGDLFAFLLGGSGSGSSSSSSPVVVAQPSTNIIIGNSAGSSSSVGNSGSSNPIHGSGQQQSAGGNSGTPTTTGSTLGITFQGGGTATAPVNEATVTVQGSSEGAKAASGALGITYSPYTDQDTCKSAQQISRDIKLLSGYSIIRLYGTDCSGIENVMAAMGSNQKIYLGVWNIASPDGELQDIVNAVKSNSRGWDAVHTIAIGNERVNAGEATVAQVQAAVDTSREYLNSNGYTGPIVTVDTLVAYVANPQLCEMSDYLAVNCHPYWDGGVSPGDSGPWLQQQISHLQSVCGTSKEVLITESGWPTQGQAYGSCVPSVENQVEAVSSIVSSLADKVIMFTMYNDYWKFSIGGAGPYGVEYYWGLYGNSPE